jgi:hypothetical protein
MILKKLNNLPIFNTLIRFLRVGLHQANIFIFGFYYKRCGDHFRQWNFIKSVKLLIQNYEHGQLLLNNEETHNRNLTRDNDELRKELFDIKIKMIVTDEQIDLANKMLGVDIKKDSQN